MPLHDDNIKTVFSKKQTHGCYFSCVKADEQFRSIGLKWHILIHCKDVNVLIPAIHYFNKLRKTSELWIKIGQVTRVQDKRRYISINEICKTLSPTFIQILPAMHVLTIQQHSMAKAKLLVLQCGTEESWKNHFTIISGR